MDSYDTSMAPRFAGLLNQRLAALGEVLRAGSGAPDADAPPNDVMDTKDAASVQALSVVDDACAAGAADELELVLAARHRLADKSYGYCLDCGEPIDLRRLTAMPAAPRCTACQAAAEHEQATALR